MSRQGALEDERGFTLIELAIIVIIMGVLFTIASSTWFGAAESRRVDSAANQLAANLRLAHTKATNKLVQQTVILSGGSSVYTVTGEGNRDLDENAAHLVAAAASYTIVFEPNGEAQITVGGNPIRVRSTDDLAPCHEIEVNSVTSRVKVSEMPVNRLCEESGYSLVEVVASILILSIAIIPMVGMFDMGINAATTASDYDKARALANLKMEEAKSLTFVAVQDNFPEPEIRPRTLESLSTGDTLFTEPDPEFANFQYNIKKQFMVEPPTPMEPPASWTFQTSAEPTGLIRVTVTVHWDDDNADPDADLSDDKTYTTSGLVAK